MTSSKTKPRTIDAYIASFPGRLGTSLRTLRRTIRKAIPGVEETISYQIPAFRQLGKYIVYFAAWKDHISLYPIPRKKSLRKILTPYIAGKGTIRFPIERPLPLGLITKVVKQHVKERTQPKGAGKGK